MNKYSFKFYSGGNWWKQGYDIFKNNNNTNHNSKQHFLEFINIPRVLFTVIDEYCKWEIDDILNSLSDEMLLDISNEQDDRWYQLEFKKFVEPIRTYTAGHIEFKSNQIFHLTNLRTNDTTNIHTFYIGTIDYHLCIFRVIQKPRICGGDFIYACARCKTNHKHEYIYFTFVQLINKNHLNPLLKIWKNISDNNVVDKNEYVNILWTLKAIRNLYYSDSNSDNDNDPKIIKRSKNLIESDSMSFF